jgi:hypothetical protein
MGPLARPPRSGTVAIATAALRAWVLKLHQVPASTGVYAAHVPIFAWIGVGGPETQPGDHRPALLDIYTKRDGAEPCDDTR